jgi:hypothetical protein
MDEARVDCVKCCVVESEPLHDTRPETFDNRARVAHEIEKSGLAGVVLQIERDRTLDAIEQVDETFTRQGLAVPKLRVETDFGSTSLLHLLRGTAMLCVAWTESFNALDGLRALNLDTNELDCGGTSAWSASRAIVTTSATLPAWISNPGRTRVERSWPHTRQSRLVQDLGI